MDSVQQWAAIKYLQKKDMRLTQILEDIVTTIGNLHNYWRLEKRNTLSVVNSEHFSRLLNILWNKIMGTVGQNLVSGLQGNRPFSDVNEAIVGRRLDSSLIELIQEYWREDEGKKSNVASEWLWPIIKATKDCTDTQQLLTSTTEPSKTLITTSTSGNQKQIGGKKQHAQKTPSPGEIRQKSSTAVQGRSVIETTLTG